MALDKQIASAKFMLVMINPDAPPLGLGGNGSQIFLQWMQDDLNSAGANVTVQGKTVFPRENARNFSAIQSYLVNNPFLQSENRMASTDYRDKSLQLHPQVLLTDTLNTCLILPDWRDLWSAQLLVT